MKTFDIRIESTHAAAIHFRVAGDSWVSAWHEALFALGDPTIPADATCTVAQARVEVDCPSHGRRFVIEQASPDPRVVSGQPMLVADGGELVPVHLEGLPPRDRSARRSTVRGAPLAHRRSEATPTTTPELSREAGVPPAVVSVARGNRKVGDKDWRNDEGDPLARVLSELERQRILARPVRINPKTGLPTPFPDQLAPRPRANGEEPASPPWRDAPRPTDTLVADRGPGPASDRRVRVDLAGLDISAPRAAPAPNPSSRRKKTEPAVPRPRQAAVTEPGLDQAATLPQQFRPVLKELVPPAGTGLLPWAADTSWQQIPCALALVLSGLETLVVLAARGQREREAVGGRLRRDGQRGQLMCRVAHRIRYAEPLPMSIEHPDGARWDLWVDSALCMPIGDPDEELSLLLINAPRPTGFTDGEASALTYLARTVAEHRPHP